MASGYFDKKYLNGGYTLRLYWSSSQSQTDLQNNRSKVNASLYLIGKPGYGLYVSSRSGTTITINGSTGSYTAPAINSGGNFNIKLAERNNIYVTHNSNGTKSISISAFYPIKATLAGTYYASMSVSGTATLDTINQAEPSVTLEQLSIDNNSAEFKINASHPYGINLYQRALNGGSYTTVSNTFTISSLNPGTSYSVRARARAGNNKYGYSNTINFVTDGGTVNIKKSGVYNDGTISIKKGSSYIGSKDVYIKKSGVWKKVVD